MRVGMTEEAWDKVHFQVRAAPMHPTCAVGSVAVSGKRVGGIWRRSKLVDEVDH